VPLADDFRTSASQSPGDYFADVPERLQEMAVKAVRTVRLEFGGVDVLEHPTFSELMTRMGDEARFQGVNSALGSEIGEVEMFEYDLSKVNSLTDAAAVLRFRVACVMGRSELRGKARS
jgi:glutathione synthase/RimK-type ligase-like ATP-grasp enzyme